MSESKTETVFVTTYALSKGILEKTWLRNATGDAIIVSWLGGVGHEAYIASGEWHRTREAAIARAEEMRKAKIASHEKSIAKLRKLTFA